MKYIKVHTERVYSHSTDGMALIETNVQTFEDGFEFEKFLKYLPFQGYLNRKLKVVRVFDKEQEYDVEKWQEMLKAVVTKIITPEKSLDEKYEDEKQRNNELQERLDALEAMIKGAETKQGKVEVPVTETSVTETPETEPTEAQLRKAYEKKFKKKAHHLWSAETIKNKLKD